jgi:GntR family transcriptional regulator
MGFQLDRSSGLPYAAQVERQAMAQLVAGRLRPGDRLPSVRQFARDLHISRTTAERIHDGLCQAMVAEVRPRSGAFVSWPDGTEQTKETERAHELYAFLKSTLTRASRLGLDPTRLAALIASLQDGIAENSAPSPLVFPVVATRESYDMMALCLGAHFPARLVHFSPTAREQRVPGHARFLLSTYYMRARALKIAKTLHCSVLCVRYNVRLLNESMAIPPGEHRYFLTRDADNAETTRVFLASAYPEVPASRYTIAAVSQWLELPHRDVRANSIWVTPTATAALAGHADASRIHVLHPLLAEDFVDELRCLALFA